MVKYKLIGVQRIEYTSKKTGNPAIAYKLFAEYKDDRIQGLGCKDFFLNERVFKETPLKCGDYFTVCTVDNFVSAVIPL